MNSIHHLLKQNLTLLLFLLVGGSTAIIYYLTVYILWSVYAIDFFLAVSIAYLISLLFYFFANRKITFKASNENILPQILKFIILLVINYTTTVTVAKAAAHFLELHLYIGMTLGILLNITINYFIGKYWIFKKSVKIETIPKANHI